MDGSSRGTSSASDPNARGAGASWNLRRLSSRAAVRIVAFPAAELGRNLAGPARIYCLALPQGVAVGGGSARFSRPGDADDAARALLVDDTRAFVGKDQQPSTWSAAGLALRRCFGHRVVLVVLATAEPVNTAAIETDVGGAVELARASRSMAIARREAVRTAIGLRPPITLGVTLKEAICTALSSRRSGAIGAASEERGDHRSQNPTRQALLGSTPRGSAKRPRR